MLGSGLAAYVLMLTLAFEALAFSCEELAADGDGEQESGEAEEGDEDEGGDVHARSAGGAEVVAAEFEVEAAPRQSQFARRARDVAVVFAQRLADHAPLKLAHRVGQR
jgi:hypothetical protein